MGIKEFAEKLRSGEISSEGLVRECLARIQENDKAGKGLNTVAEINPFAVYEAMAADKELKKGICKGSLHGIPVLLKDNIDVKGLHTTAGSYALHDLIADQDSPVAAKLKAAGAIILGKANLSEFAYWMSTQDMPNGYSSMGGQVVHAYNPTFDVSGSSSGSAVAVSARFVPAAIGSETCGSLMSPGIANAIVTLKPTVGLVSRDGIIPISHTQDTAGPMALSVEDCAIMLSVLAGRDENDPATWMLDEQKGYDYTKALKKDLTGMRIGVFTDKAHPRTEKQAAVQASMKEKILAAGAEVEEIEYEDSSIPYMDILSGEFKNGLNRYLAGHKSKCRALSEIIEFNKVHADRCLAHGQDLLESSEDWSGLLYEEKYLKARAEADEKGKALIDDLMEEKKLDCLVSAVGRITSFAAVRGTCSLVVPAVEFNVESYEPVSYFLIGKPFCEEKMIQVGYVLEQMTGILNKPEWVREF